MIFGPYFVKKTNLFTCYIHLKYIYLFIRRWITKNAENVQLKDGRDEPHKMYHEAVSETKYLTAQSTCDISVCNTIPLSITYLFLYSLGSLWYTSVPSDQQVTRFQLLQGFYWTSETQIVDWIAQQMLPYQNWPIQCRPVPGPEAGSKWRQIFLSVRRR